MSDPILKSKRIGAAVAYLLAIYLAKKYGYEMSSEMQSVTSDIANEIIYGVGSGAMTFVGTWLTAWSKHKDLK